MIAAFGLGAAIVIAAPFASPAQGSVTAALARQLVSASFGEDQIRRDARTSFETSFRASLLRDPQVVAAQSKMPGVVDAIVKASADEMARVYDGIIVEMKAISASTYATALSENHLRDCVAFYSSPLGQKLVALAPQMMKGVDVLSTLSVGEQEAFLKFRASPAGRKFAETSAPLMRTMMQRTPAAMRDAMPRIQNAGRAAAQKYVTSYSGS